MYISDIFKTKERILSLEAFPPKADDGMEKVKSAVREMAALDISYMSVTYGAGGSTSKRTADICEMLEGELSTTALAHLTCVNSTKEDIKKQLDDFKARGIKNILALRGDIPQGATKEEVLRDFTHASDLASFIKDNGEFCVGGACYPECHPDSPNVDADIDALKIKMDAGCDFLVTQMFFDNFGFYRFRNACEQRGITIPISAGIMPLTNIKQIEKMCILSGGATMPGKFTKMIAKFSDSPEALKQAGIAYAVDQITDLVSNDTPGIHIYTMNRPSVVEKIVGVIDGYFK